MKKLRLLTKSLLVVAGLLMGATSAWAKSSVWSENFESATTASLQSAWTKNRDGSWGDTYSPHLELASNNYGNTTNYLFAYDNNTSRQRAAYYMFGSAYTGKAYQLDAKINLNVGNSSGESRFYIMNGAKSDYNNDPSNYLFYIGGNTSGFVYVSNGTETETSTIGNADKSENLSQSQGKTYKSTGWFNVSCIIDMTAGNVKVTITKGTSEETFTINLKSGTKQISGFGIITGKALGGSVGLDDMTLYELTVPAFTLSESAKAVSVDGSETVSVTDITGTISVRSDNTAAATATYDAGVVTINGVATGVATITVTGTNDGVTLDKTIDVTVGSVATTDVTVNYLDESSSAIASPLVISDVYVGSTLTAAEVVYSDVLYGTGCRYVSPVLSESLPYVVEEDGVINITYTTQEAVTNVKKIVKAGATEVSNENVAQDGKYVGDRIYFSFPAYINHNGTLYSKSANASTYSQSFDLTENNQECVLAYSATSITNVVYFSEGESIATSTSAGNNMSGRSSNQACGYAESDLTLVNLPAGSYKTTAVLYSNSSGGTTLNFQYDDDAHDAVVQGASNASTDTHEFTFTSAADVKWLTSGDNKNGLDYIYIQKTAEPVTVTDAGMATYVNSTYDLNFSETDIKAYKVKVSTKGTATLTEVANVPAGTPVLLVKDGGATESIPVMAGAAAVTENDLVVGTGAAVPTTDGAGNTNMILNKVGGNVGFYFANGQTVAANRAYLHIATTLAPDAAIGARMAMVFGDETTGINAVQGSGVKVNGSEAVYNLNGQRVAQPTKGLYIVNGKKVLVK